MVGGGEEKHRRKRRKIFGEGKYLFFPKGKEKEESSGERKLMVTPTNRANIEQSAFSKIKK